jgi:hypothetical protein
MKQVVQRRDRRPVKVDVAGQRSEPRSLLWMTKKPDEFLMMTEHLQRRTIGHAPIHRTVKLATAEKQRHAIQYVRSIVHGPLRF